MVIVPGWTEVDGPEGMEPYFRYFEQKRNGKMYYYRMTLPGYEYLANATGTPEEIRAIVERHEQGT